MRDPISNARPRDSAARTAGILLLLSAAATVVMVFARVAADADHPSLANTMVAIAKNRAMYNLSGAARVLSALTLMAAAWYLLKTWIIRERLGTTARPLPVPGIRHIHRRIGSAGPRLRRNH